MFLTTSKNGRLKEQSPAINSRYVTGRLADSRLWKQN